MPRVSLPACLLACLLSTVSPVVGGTTANLEIVLVKRVPSLPVLPPFATRASIEASLRELGNTWHVVIDDTASSRGMAATLRITLIAR